MDKLGSPEIPAYLSYLLVLICGMLVARSQVNRLLSAFPQRWGFLSTWALFWAHAALPLLLFWFLDYTNALHDTSLFAALLVAFGYRQVFVGGIESIRLPGQTQRLWKPFEVWVNRLVQHITFVSKQYLDRFDERVTSTLAGDASDAKLLETAFLKTNDRDRLEKALQDLEQEALPPGMPPEAFERIKKRKRVAVLLRDLRTSVGEDYGYYLYQQRVIRFDRYVRWFGNVRSRVISYGVTTIVFIVLIVGFYLTYASPAVQIRYSQWRFLKANNTDFDRFRNRNSLITQIQAGNVNAVLEPILDRLRYKDCSNELCDNVLRLVVDTHRPQTDHIVIPRLIEALRTENSDVRLRLLRALIDLAKASYDVSALKDEMSWVPAKDDSPGVIDAHVRAWHMWWANVSGAQQLLPPLAISPAPSPTGSPSP